LCFPKDACAPQGNGGVLQGNVCVPHEDVCASLKMVVFSREMLMFSKEMIVFYKEMFVVPMDQNSCALPKGEWLCSLGNACVH